MVAEKPAKNPAFDYPPLTVLPVVDDPSRFYCLGRHEWWYEVRLKTDSQAEACECKGFGFRSHCRHLDAVKERLRKEHPCPMCTSHLSPVTEYVEGKGYSLRDRCAAGCGYSRSL